MVISNTIMFAGSSNSRKIIAIFLKSRVLCTSVPKALPSALPLCVRCPLLSGLFNLGLVLTGQTYEVSLSPSSGQLRKFFWHTCSTEHSCKNRTYLNLIDAGSSRFFSNRDYKQKAGLTLKRLTTIAFQKTKKSIDLYHIQFIL